jgi:hypothetical protein
MGKKLLSVVVLAGLAGPAAAQTYIAPAGTDIPSSGLGGLSKADRKKVCTLLADDRRMTGPERQRFRAACRGRPIPR